MRHENYTSFSVCKQSRDGTRPGHPFTARLQRPASGGGRACLRRPRPPARRPGALAAAPRLRVASVTRPLASHVPRHLTFRGALCAQTRKLASPCSGTAECGRFCYFIRVQHEACAERASHHTTRSPQQLQLTEVQRTEK